VVAGEVLEHAVPQHRASLAAEHQRAGIIVLLWPTLLRGRRRVPRERQGGALVLRHIMLTAIRARRARLHHRARPAFGGAPPKPPAAAGRVRGLAAWRGG